MPSKVRILVTSNANQKKKAILILSSDCANPLLEINKVAKNKLLLKNPTRHFMVNGKNSAFELKDDKNEELKELLKKLDYLELVVSAKEDYVGTIAAKENIVDTTISIFARKSYVDEEAINQIKTIKYPFLTLACGMPDLHPGNTFPIGASFISRDNMIYPLLIGNDVGCGMALYQMKMPSKGLNATKIERNLTQMEGRMEDWKSFSERVSGYNQFKFEDEIHWQLGTIGGGNHFAELVIVDDIIQESLVPKGFDRSKAFLLVHSGSRLLGQKVLQEFRKNNQEDGLSVDSENGKEYIKLHDYACAWAKMNRELIAYRFHNCLDFALEDSVQLLDIWHNSLYEKEKGIWIHRKGAAPSDQGLVVIPGSRGAYSYLVMPKDPQNQWNNAFSLAHGAGRKMYRGKAATKIRDKMAKQASASTPDAVNELLRKTPFESAVICEDKKLLAEEHQDAYKEIEDIISDLVEFGLIEVVVRFKPVVTYKMRNG
jgi:release factor H-coupled RctB family protein